MAFPKPRLRTESTPNRPSNRLAELSRLAGWLKPHSTSKCAKWLMLRAENRFLSRAPLRPPEGCIEGTQAHHMPVSDLPGELWRLSDSRTKTAPLLIRCAVLLLFFFLMTVFLGEKAGAAKSFFQQPATPCLSSSRSPELPPAVQCLRALLRCC